MYINPKLHYDTISQSRKLRATPHSVGLATQNFSKTRTWFGLMILSPADAYSEKDGRSYGELRHLLATSPIEDIPGRLGCSSVEHRAPIMPSNVSTLVAKFSDGWAHGDYYLSCTDSVEEVTPYPTLPYYPRDNETCTTQAWEEASNSTVDFDHMFDLITDKTTAKFFWSVNEQAGTIKGKLTFGDIFGYLAFGFANTDPDTGHNGMNGAEIIMAS